MSPKRPNTRYVPSGKAGICSTCRRPCELLIVDRRNERRHVSTALQASTATDMAPAVTSRVVRPRAAGVYVYKAKDRRRNVTDLPSARLDAYKALQKAKAPLTVREVAAKSKHPKETTQQLLAALVAAGYAVRDTK